MSEELAGTDKTTDLFHVSNHHTESCGTPPSINADMPNVYHSYFENEEGEQAIFTYDRTTKMGLVVLGDAGWENVYNVDGGYAEGLVLSDAEKFWLIASWSAATRHNVLEAFQQATAQEARYVERVRLKASRSNGLLDE